MPTRAFTPHELAQLSSSRRRLVVNARSSVDLFPCGHQTNFKRVMEATGRSGIGQHHRKEQGHE